MHGVPNTEVHASTMLDGQPSPSRIGIVLSAGYFGFFAHAGFMLGIEELGIDYSAIAGSSAGAIVAALHEQGLTAARQEIQEHRLKALADSESLMTWVEPLVPPIGPNTLSEGRSAVDAAYRHAIDSLSPLIGTLTLSG